MKKLFVIGLIITTIITACRDEINIPEYDSYVDNNSPSFEIIFPSIDTTISGKDTINFEIICKDDYEIDSFFFEIQPADFSSELFTYKTAVNDSVYIFNLSYPLPTKDSMRYEAYVKAIDVVGNSNNKVYFFTAK
tara:strand:- start:2793 stop:3197 length:405 start_codon:yes stop_codon:yes gene_type:complete